MTKQNKERRVIVAVASIAVLVLFAACDGAGAGGGGGAGTSGGSATIELEASGTYVNDPNNPDFSIQYSWIDADVGSQSDAVFEDQISLPWTTELTLDVGTGVSINLIGQEAHSNSMTLSIRENGNLVAEHSINEIVSPGELQPPVSGGGAGLTHVVGQ